MLPDFSIIFFVIFFIFIIQLCFLFWTEERICENEKNVNNKYLRAIRDQIPTRKMIASDLDSKTIIDKLNELKNKYISLEDLAKDKDIETYKKKIEELVIKNRELEVKINNKIESINKKEKI